MATLPIRRVLETQGRYRLGVGPTGGAASSCPHGLTPATCEICRVLGAGPAAVPARRRRPGPARPKPGGIHIGLGGMAVAAVVAVVVLVQVLAVVSMVVRLAQLVGVAAVAGYAGFKVGVVAGRREKR